MLMMMDGWMAWGKGMHKGWDASSEREVGKRQQVEAMYPVLRASDSISAVP